MINPRALAPADYSDRRKYVALFFEESGNPHLTIYADSAGIPTIGIGFNLRSLTTLNVVVEAFEFDLENSAADRTYRDRLLAVFNANTPANWQSSANAIMSERAAAMGGGVQSTFTFADLTHVFTAFDILIPQYEDSADVLGPNAADSYERLAIIDMNYNGVLAGSNLFRTGWEAGDRAEAWFEIVFDTNAERISGILKRRYLEGELFGLYDGETGQASFRPTEAEALRIFRMFNKHELQINGEIAAFGGALGAA